MIHPTYARSVRGLRCRARMRPFTWASNRGFSAGISLAGAGYRCRSPQPDASARRDCHHNIANASFGAPQEAVKSDERAALDTGRTRALEPNMVWTADFKGEFRLKGGTGPYCYPLTVLDLHSRFSHPDDGHPLPIAAHPSTGFRLTHHPGSTRLALVSSQFGSRPIHNDQC